MLLHWLAGPPEAMRSLEAPPQFLGPSVWGRLGVASRHVVGFAMR